VSQERILILAIRWLILAAAVWVAAEVLPGIHLEGWGSTLFVALVLGLLNLYVKPVLFWLSIPLTIVTLGLFLIVLNAILLLLADWIANIDSDIRFDVEGLLDAILGAIIISIVSTIIGWFVDPAKIARGVSGRF
jgi:putative membrane protein